MKKTSIIILSIVCVVVIVAGILGVVCLAKRAKEISKMLDEAQLLSQGYFYEDAKAVLEKSEYKSAKIVEAMADIEHKKEELAEYDGQFYHIFFHSLIVYPELAFDGDYMHEGYDMWMTTVSEFEAMLPQLYERGFVLYSLDNIKPGEKVMLPKGKKPLVISIDDVNYYGYMKNDGFADRLVVDDDGYVACEVKRPDGEMEISYRGDVMPILDNFVKEHPDFSYQGAKGVVALTGYEGAFGYNFIKAEGEEQEVLKTEATKVAQALKNTGWLIACHSYTHNEYFKDSKVTDEQLHYDTNRFKERIYDVVLQPDIYISPFGYHLKEGDPRLQYLKDMGYNYFCPVSPSMRTFTTAEGVVVQERFNMDRYNMRTKKDYINETFFDVDKVYYNIP